MHVRKNNKSKFIAPGRNILIQNAENKSFKFGLIAKLKVAFKRYNKVYIVFVQF